MDGNPELWEAVGAELGSPVRQTRRITGGDISHAFLARLVNGEAIFCKTHPHPHPRMFQVEADGLDFLRTPGGPQIPRVLALRDATSGPGFLVLERVRSAPSSPASETRMGEALATLHRGSTSELFGYPESNYIGTLAQENDWQEDWATFFVERRLWPQVQQAHRILGRSLLRTLDSVLEKAREELRTEEPPCRVHGDLWAGNRIIDDQGEPWLIDPAVVHGNREMDLAMMQLFGGFGPECFAAYNHLAPLEPESDRRAEYYQLFFLLVHVNLHGASWAGQVAQVAWGLS
jgi:fructosamine-3-kinase